MADLLGKEIFLQFTEYGVQCIHTEYSVRLCTLQRALVISVLRSTWAMLTPVGKLGIAVNPLPRNFNMTCQNRLLTLDDFRPIFR